SRSRAPRKCTRRCGCRAGFRSPYPGRVRQPLWCRPGQVSKSREIATQWSRSRRPARSGRAQRRSAARLLPQAEPICLWGEVLHREAGEVRDRRSQARWLHKSTTVDAMLGRSETPVPLVFAELHKLFGSIGPLPVVLANAEFLLANMRV